MLQSIKIISTLLLVWLFSACKENVLIQTTDIPAVDNINTFFSDTNTVIARNVVLDSFQTGGAGASSILITNWPGLGSINSDPAFGSTVASIAFQVRPPKNLLKFPTNGTLVTDSVILAIPYRSVYGDTTPGNTQTFNLYRLIDTLESSKKLYTNTSVAYDPTIIGSTTVDFSKMDSVIVGGVKKEPQIRIALSADFAAKLLALTDTIEYKNADAFKTWLKGFYITPADTNAGKAIGHFFMPGVTMTYYFRNTVNSVIDTTQYIFKYDAASCSHYNRITRNYNKSASNGIKAQLNTGNVLGDAQLYAQGDFGATIEVKIPYIHKMANAVINKADLEFTVVGSGYPLADTAFRAPLRLFPWRVYGGRDSIFYTQFSPNISNNSLLSNTVNGVTKKRYLIDISSQVQKAVTLKDSTLQFRVRGLNTTADATMRQGNGRIVLGGSNTTTDKLKLNIIYTKIK